MTAPTADRQTPIGQTVIGRTTYLVYALPVGETAARAGVAHNFSLEGPRGALFMVIDYGRRYALNSVSCGRGGVRGLRGLTRGHLAAFGVEA